MFFFAVLAACGSGDSTADDDEFDLNSLVVEDDLVQFDASAALGFADREGADEAQQSVLGDGRLTFAEYEQQVLATVECATSSGADVRNLGIDSTRGYPSIRLAIADGDQDVYDECARDKSMAVEMLWMTGHGQAEQTQDEREKLLRVFAECVADNSDTPIDVDAVVRRDVSVGEVVQVADRVIAEGGENCFDVSGYGG